MVQNNKVLTVSYGTFSCTLEGFDDSFETMKAITEYFRDLAADDRYFGSEPPQPDTEMLTKIAQRDERRKVEARQSDAGLLIRATDEPAPSAPDLNVIKTPPPPPPVFVDAKAETVEDTPAPAEDSIAAKLQRIRAVVSHSEENSVIYTEDEETTLMKSTAGPSDAVAAAFAAGSLNPADFETLEEADAVDETSEAEPEMPQIGEVEEFAAPALDIEHEAQDQEAEIQVTEIEEEAEDEVASIDILFSDIDETGENEPEGDEVTNILSDAGADEDASTTVPEGIMTEDDEIHLLDEIASLESILAGRAETTEAKASDLDHDVSRLMDKVGEHLDDPDTSNRREAYTQLRAAVAVTEAERSEKGDADQYDDDQDYRGDLSSVVSPRRPEVQVTSARPASDEAAPLKLVAEQRIDNQSEDAGPVTPRRVTSETEGEEAATEESGFALFAQEQGAQSLPDLLEAAAAYLSFIEGQEQFSRPQLMNKIRSLKQDEFNREESLRSFGQLLRDGKIEKAGGGRFAASTQIGFRPDDERAAG